MRPFVVEVVEAMKGTGMLNMPSKPKGITIL